VTTAVSWLIDTHQNEDGGYTGFSSGAGIAPSDVGGTVDALLAIGSGGYNPSAALDFLRQEADAVAAYAAADGSAAGKLLLAVTAAHQNPRSFAGLDLVELLAQHEQPTGQFGVDNAFGQSLAILGLVAAGEIVPETAVTWLLEQQAGDGSWDDGFGTTGNSDATALAIMALVAADGPDADGLDAAIDFLAQAQLADGGWEYGPGFGFSLNSTALVTQALAAVGVDIGDTAGEWAANGRSPLDVLLAAQSETGAFQADFGDGPFDDFFTTVQAIPALTGQPFPLPAYSVAAAQGASCLLTLQDPDSGGWEEFATFGPNAAGTARAVLALTAVDKETDEAVQVLAEQAPDYLLTSFGGGVGLIMQAVAAAGGDVTDFAGTDLTALMAENLADSGEYDDTSLVPMPTPAPSPDCWRRDWNRTQRPLPGCWIIMKRATGAVARTPTGWPSTSWPGWIWPRLKQLRCCARASRLTVAGALTRPAPAPHLRWPGAWWLPLKIRLRPSGAGSWTAR
jgi:hypothetical protein